MLEDNTYDVTLVFGPLYHLYEADEVNKAIDEAIRVTKKNGVILFAFISVFAISEEDFSRLAEWYMAFSEKRELLGNTNHLLYICRKQ